VTDPRPAPLILDELGQRLEQFRLLDADEEGADRILAELGGSGKVELDMVGELAAHRPLGHPERVAEAHALAMHALEVLTRNGGRPPSQLRLVPLTPVARFAVQQVIRFIVRSHESHVIDSVRDLYARRLAWVPVHDPARTALVRARLDAERATQSYKEKAFGIPTFLLGGAFISSIAQSAQGGASRAAGSRTGLVVTIVATFVLLAAASWVILRGAAIARRRIRLTLDRPLAALWETIGWCGRPPRDTARTFAVVAIVLTALGWLLIPLAVLLATLR
jgi:hypothetical protein